MEPWNNEIERLGDACESFAGRWFRNKPYQRSLVVCGQTGSGKTHAMRGLHKFASQARTNAAELAFWRWPATVQWTDWPMVARLIGEREESMWSALHDSMEADLLFLDDVGAESDKFKNGESVDALCQLLSRRDGMWTMITTNIAPGAWKDRFDVRVADRLNRGGGEIVQLDCGSYSLR